MGVHKYMINFILNYVVQVPVREISVQEGGDMYEH